MDEKATHNKASKRIIKNTKSNADKKRSGTKCLRNQPYDVIKMREMKGEVRKKTPKKEMDFYDVI